ncbi:MAG TPA: restriction endonuclease subunit S [Gemmatales bacterium]|nr:restriction endonuclease subunit S [Gemmatales bacterium]
MNVQLPSHWKTRRLKFIASVQLSNVDKKSVEGEASVRLCNYVDVYKNDFITPDMEFMEATASERQIRDFSLKAGDVLITKDSEAWNDIAVPALVANDLDGVLCGYHLAHIRPKPKVMFGGFLFRAFAAEGIADQFRVAANGITRFGIGKDEITGALFPVPPLAEQHAIADFLDRKTAQIDGVISKKQRMIDLLHEKRQSLISEAVTKGLDPDVPTKDSGIEWLGRVPRHWLVERLKWRMRRIEQGWSPQCETRQADPGEWGVLKVGCMNSGIYDESENKALPTDLEPLPEFEVRVGDILMSRSNTVELVGCVGRVHRTQGKIHVCDKLYRLVFDGDRLDPDFAVLLLSSHPSRLQIERDASGASPSMKNISNEVVADLVLAFPPLDEQRQVVKYVTQRLDELRRLGVMIESQIAKLREYRQTLISAAVTGQIDVTTEGQR